MNSDKFGSMIVQGHLPDFSNSPEGFYDLHVTDKGKKLVEDYESRTTFRGMWRRYYLLIFGWIFGIVSALIIIYLTHAYFH
jgi:hypothetical protein